MSYISCFVRRPPPRESARRVDVNLFWFADINFFTKILKFNYRFIFISCSLFRTVSEFRAFCLS